MLPKKRRISRLEFANILSKGKRYNSPHLLLYIANNSRENHKNSVFSFSISKKVCPSAVDRNKYRRQGYSVVGKHLKLTKPGFSCFFSFKRGIQGLTFVVLEKEILELLSKSGVLL